MRWPEADFEVTEDVARSLLADQCPDLASRPLEKLTDGFDNTLWRLGEDLVGRFPRRALAIELMNNELRWLSLLAPRLPLPIPVAVRTGRPSAEYPSPWAVTKWLPGDPADLAELAAPDEAAEALGQFLRALHQPSPREAPRNGVRGGPVRSRSQSFEERMVSLRGEHGVTDVRRTWDAALDAQPWSGPPVWLHGDLHPANLLVTAGSLSAVLDLGDVCSGDPACDLAGGWMLLPPSSINTFLSAYENWQPDLVARARGWAVLFGLFFIELGLAGHESYLTVGQSTLATVRTSEVLD